VSERIEPSTATSATTVSKPHPPADPPPSAPSAAGLGRLPQLLAAAVIVLGLDVATKIVAVAVIDPNRPIRIVGDTVTLRLVRNAGAAFSMATGMTWVLALIAIGVAVGVVRYGRRLRSGWWTLALGLVLGGTVGNLVDRFFRSPGPLRGHVVDFVSVGWWPVFNVADSAIVCGAAAMVVLTVFGVEPDRGAE
jgi:signal peptidase II